MRFINREGTDREILLFKIRIKSDPIKDFKVYDELKEECKLADQAGRSQIQRGFVYYQWKEEEDIKSETDVMVYSEVS